MNVQEWIRQIEKSAGKIGRKVRLMEVCGTHTLAAVRSGLHSLLSEYVELISGPGCPVCVTPVRYIDRAIALAKLPRVIVATFGDMMRVPGSSGSLEQARAAGATVRVVYSALDALCLAANHGEASVVFLGIGFETTAPGTAWAIRQAVTRVPNFYVLCGHKTMPQVMAQLASAPDLRIDGFICPGHVSVVIGAKPYRFLAEEHKRPCVISGFRGEDLVESVALLLRQIEEGRAEVEIQYRSTVRWEGNPSALALLEEIFEPCDDEWRGIGVVPGSGLRIRDNKYKKADADAQFGQLLPAAPIAGGSDGCICGEILKGIRKPIECPLFGSACTPDCPVGACMVSREGACSVYYRFGRTNTGGGQDDKK